MSIVKDIYIVHVGGYVGSYMPSKHCPQVSYAPHDKFIDFVQGLREDYPDYRLRCIINHGIEQKVWQQINLDKLAKFRNNGRAD